MKRTLAAVAVFAYAFLSISGVAYAHALLLRSDPVQDAVLAHEPSHIHLWFSEDLNTSLSKAIVWNVHRTQVDLKDDRITNNRELTVSLAPHLADGTYLVLWTSVSSQDGHVLKGAFLFSIGHRGPAPATPSLSGGANGQAFPPDLIQFTGLVSRTLELASSALWLGLALFLVAVIPPTTGVRSALALSRQTTKLALRLMPVALAVLFVSRLATLIIQANTLASGDWATTFSAATLKGLVLETEYGHIWIAMQALALFALAVSLVALRQRTRGEATAEADARALSESDRPEHGPSSKLLPRLAWNPVSLSGLQLLLALAASFLLAASGHAATVNLSRTGTGIFTIPVFLDWLHVVATGLWVGGIFAVSAALVPAFVRLRGETPGPLLDTLDRFSPFAYGSVAVLALTGGFNAKVHVPSWDAFFDSVYGRSLIIKMALVLTMILISAFTVFTVRPRLRRRSGASQRDEQPARGFLQAVLLQWLRIEALLGIGVFAATAMLNAYPVPLTFGASTGPVAVTARTHGLTVTLKLNPGKAGLNTFTVLLKQRKKPVPLADVRVLESMLDMSMGTQFVLLHQTGPGTFKGPGDVSMGGHWSYLVQIRLPSKLNLIYQDFRVLVGG